MCKVSFRLVVLIAPTDQPANRDFMMRCIAYLMHMYGVDAMHWRGSVRIAVKYAGINGWMDGWIEEASPVPLPLPLPLASHSFEISTCVSITQVK